MNITPSKLYKMKEELPEEEMTICLSVGIEPGEILWLDGSRPSPLGGYLGNFRQTYSHALGVSPKGKTFQNMPMRYFSQTESLSTE